MPIFLEALASSEVHRLVSVARSGTGDALDTNIRDELSPKFGDLSDVRVHTDAPAAAASRALNASAFTFGRDLFFGSGAYRPASPSGRNLIAHEAAHAVQQRAATGESLDVAPDARAEKDAHRASVLRARPEVQATSARAMASPKTAQELADDFYKEEEWTKRDEKGLGERLFNLALDSPKNFQLVGEVLEKLDRGGRKGVASAFVDEAGPMILDSFARKDQGRIMVEKLRDSFLRPGIVTFREVALKIGIEDVLGRAEGRNRAEGRLDKAAKESESAATLAVESVTRRDAPERLQLVRQMLLHLQMLYPKDAEIAAAIAGAKSNLDAQFGKLLYSYTEEDGKKIAATQLIVERAFQSITKFDLIFPTLDDKDLSQTHRFHLARRVRSDWAEVIKHAALPEGPRRLAVAEAESAALPEALKDLYLGSLSQRRAHLTGMADGVDEMVAWVNWVRAKQDDLDAELVALKDARVKGATGLEQREAKASKENELIAMSIQGIQLWEQGIRAYESLYVEVHPLLNVVPHVPLTYRDSNRIRARCQQMKSAALANDLEKLKQLADDNRKDPNIQQYLRALPLFIYGAKAFPGLIGNLFLSYSILRLSMAAGSAMGQLISTESGSLTAVAAQVGLESLTFTAANRTLQAAVGSPAKTPFLMDLVLNIGLFGVLRLTAPALHSALASRGMDFAAWAAPQVSTFGLLQGFGALTFRIEEGRWPSAVEIRDMSLEGLIMFAALARTRAPAAREPSVGRFAILEKLHSKYGDRLGAFEEARMRLAHRISVEVRAGKTDDQKVQKSLQDESTALNEDLRKLVDDIKKDPDIKAKALRDALASPAVSSEDTASALLSGSLELPAATMVRRAGGESQFTYEHGATEALIEALEAKGTVFREVDAHGRSLVTAQPADQAPMFFLERPPAAAFAPGTAPRRVTEITSFLKKSGLSAAEIIGFGKEDASSLDATSARRVAKLAEHFTASDLKALGDFLFRYEIVIDNALIDALIERVPAGDMADAVANLEAAARQMEQTGTQFDLAESLGISVRSKARSSRSSAKAPKDAPKYDPGFRMAEIQAGPALEEEFGGTDWVPSKRTRAPGAAKDELLGSTVPDWSSAQLKMAVEVKRLNLAEMGVGPAGERLGPPSKETEEALARARSQLEGRQWVLKKGTQQVLIFNVTGQATDVVAVGKRLRMLIGERFIDYDRVYVQDKLKLTEIKAEKKP